MLSVLKFGGTSLGDATCLRRVAETIAGAHRAGETLAVVVSAMGETTDDLLHLARELSPVPSPRELDALLNTGENQSAALLAIALQSCGVEAVSFSGWQSGIYTDGSYGAAAIRSFLATRVREVLQRGAVAVISGFQGLAPNGDVTTLGRGGSDTTAVALASALGSDECCIFTDVDGIYTADPRLVPGARLLPAIDARDMLRLALSGAQVLHARCVSLAMERGVRIRLRSAFGGGEGTLVTLLGSERPKLAGLAVSREHDVLRLVGTGVDAALCKRIDAALAAAGIEILSERHSRGNFSLRCRGAQLLTAAQEVHRLVFEQ